MYPSMSDCHKDIKIYQTCQHYFIVGQSLLAADLGLPSVCVCLLSVLTGIEPWICWSDFNVTSVPLRHFTFYDCFVAKSDFLKVVLHTWLCLEFQSLARIKSKRGCWLWLPLPLKVCSLLSQFSLLCKDVVHTWQAYSRKGCTPVQSGHLCDRMEVSVMHSHGNVIFWKNCQFSVSCR